MTVGAPQRFMDAIEEVIVDAFGEIIDVGVAVVAGTVLIAAALAHFPIPHRASFAFAGACPNAPPIPAKSC